MLFQALRTPVKEGPQSPIKTPKTDSPVHRSKPHREESPLRAEKPLSPQKPPVSLARDDDYEEDFEKTNENVSSLEEDRRKDGKLETSHHVL